MNGGLNNRQFVLVIVIIIICGFAILGYDYFMAKRNGVYEEMSVLLSQEPEYVEPEEETETPNVQNPGANQNQTPAKPATSNYTYKYDGRLKIDKINLNKGFLKYGKRGNDVNLNVSVMKGSTYPDEIYSHLILAAHNGTRWNAFFKDIEKLSLGDVATIKYNKKLYTYKLIKIYKDRKNDGSISLYRNSSKKHLTLVTCKKPDYKKYYLVLAFELESEERI